jgi:hypothetical protein
MNERLEYLQGWLRKAANEKVEDNHHAIVQ